MRFRLSLSLTSIMLFSGCALDGLSSQETTCRTDGPRSTVESAPESDDHGQYLAGMSVVGIEPGIFLMGSEVGHPHRMPVEALHETELTRGFFIGETEVTQAQFIAYAGYDPVIYNPGCDNCPVQEVSWDEIAAFTNAMSDAHGLERCYDCEGEGLDVQCLPSMNPYDCQGYRMPTEAEWEYAANGGESFEYPASDNLDEVGWWLENSGMKPHEVAELAPNGFGLYDMAGNVMEWVGYGKRFHKLGF